MAIDLTILGSSGSHTGPGRACSGYLLTVDDTRVMVDCGNGSTANLQRTTRFEELDAVVITHRHVDHCVDLIGMFYAMRFHAEGQKAIDLYASPEVMDLLTGLLSEDSRFRFHEVFRHVEVKPGDRFEVGPLGFEAFESVHPVPTMSLRITAGDSVLAYSADSAGGPELVRCAQGADLFLCEATWTGEAADYPPGIHLTAKDAGALATDAGVGRLVLTHILGSVDRELALREVGQTFAGDVQLAEDNDTYAI